MNKCAGRYNGNISGIEWQTAQECAVKGYGFIYDKMNRLNTAYFAEQTATAGPWNQAVGDYNSTYAYDQNGNIELLTRYGPLNGGSFGTIDQLLYTYTGNRLQKVDETSGTTVAAGIDHFIDGTNPGNDYSYDQNGNLTQDLNRDVTMTYNHFNKPVEVDAANGDQVVYIYAADGTKLRQKVLNSSQVVLKTTDYIGGFQYIQDVGFKVMEHFTHPRGRVMLNGDYQYFLQDHLGNTRVVFGDLDQDGLLNPDPQTGPDVAQIAAYYPFGMRMAGIDNFNASPVNQYLYNGKEVQDELGLNWIDYGARMHDPSIGRWNGVDPLADDPNQIFLSPYNYTWNNPINLTDPDGRCPNCLTAGAGAVLGAAIGGGLEIATQLWNDGEVSDWKAVGGSALQGAVTGAAAGFTGGASLATTAVVSGTANAAGGTLNRAIQGQETTAGDVVVDATLGAGLGAAGAAAGKATQGALDKLSNAAKGKLGETVTRVKYAFKGYVDGGRAKVPTGRTTPTGRPQQAHYDHSMRNPFTGKELTVETKFNTFRFTQNQINAKPNVSTPGGLIEERVTSQQLGNGVRAITNGVGAGVATQASTKEKDK